jgi:hypothetical protein
MMYPSIVLPLRLAASRWSQETGISGMGKSALAKKLMEA